MAKGIKKMINDDKIKQILTKIHARREIMQELVRANIKDRNEIRELEVPQKAGLVYTPANST